MSTPSVGRPQRHESDSRFPRPRLEGGCWRSAVIRVGLALFALLTAASCKVADKPAAVVSPQHLVTLFAQLQSSESAPDIQAIVAETRDVPRTDPNWPTLTYLVGEAQLKRK